MVTPAVTRSWIASLLGLAVVAMAMPGPSVARDTRYSGTVVAVDRAVGSIVIEGMGPWRVENGVTRLDRRTVGILPSTELVRLERAAGPASSGWIGDFVERPLPERRVKPGDWVTVTLGAEATRATAVRVEVWEPGASAGMDRP
jgi:hypothetical protein